MLVGVCGDDSALWRYGRKPPLTHTLPHYHVTWRIPAAPPLGDAFDLDLELEQRCFAALLRSDVSAPRRRPSATPLILPTLLSLFYGPALRAAC